MTGKAFRFMIMGGVFGPLIFTIITIICASLRPEYSHLHNLISELGATGTPNQRLMNSAGFIPSGFLISLFGLTLLVNLSTGIVSKSGFFLLVLFGLGMATAGIYSCDAGCVTGGSLDSEIHDKVSAVTFFSAIFGIILSGLFFRKNNLFRGMATYSIVSGIVSAILLVIMISSFESRHFTGLWQRLLLLSIFVWTCLITIRTFKIIDKPVEM